MVRNRHHMDNVHCLTQFVSPHMLPAALSLEAHDEVQNVGHVLGRVRFVFLVSGTRK